jgi:hypothetical protein
MELCRDIAAADRSIVSVLTVSLHGYPEDGSIDALVLPANGTAG